MRSYCYAKWHLAQHGGKSSGMDGRELFGVSLKSKALENHIDIAQEVFIIKALIDFFLREILRDIRVLLDVRAEVFTLEPAFHCIALYPFICIFTQHAFADHSEHDALAVDKAAGLVHVCHHGIRINQKLVDDISEPNQTKEVNV